MKATVMLKRSIKYLLYLGLFLLSLLALLMVCVLHTTSGSRWAVNYGIKNAGMDLTYDHFEGDLSDGLIIKNIKYNSQDIDIEIEKIQYISKWSWLDRHVEISQFDLNNVLITAKTSNKQQQSQPFTGIEMPISIDLNEFKLHGLTVHSKTGTHHIDDIDLVAEINHKMTSINHLKVTSADHGINVIGHIEYRDGLNYSFETDWLMKLEKQVFDGQGQILGGLDEVKLNHQVNIENDQFQGHYEIQGMIHNLENNPEFNGQIAGERSNLLIGEQSLELKDTLLELSGSMQKYKLSLQTDLNSKSTDEINMPRSQLILKATGNEDQLITQTAQLTTADGSIDLSAEMNWDNQLNIKSNIQVIDFNPGQLVESWPGQLAGVINLNLELSEQGVVIKTQNNELKGQLKNQFFKVAGGVDYAANTFSSDHLNVVLGKNSVFIDGQINKDDTALTAVIQWPDLSVLGEGLAGSIEGSVGLEGDYLNPQFKANLSGQEVELGSHQLASIKLVSEGVWGGRISSQSIIKSAVLNEQSIDLIEINQRGWLDDHSIELKLKHKNIRSTASLEGVYKNQNNKQLNWRGTLLEHELIIGKNSSVKLLKPVKIAVGESISVEEGCWQDIQAGNLCLKFKELNTKQNRYQALLSADAFSLAPLNGMAPAGFRANGQIHGSAELFFSSNDFKLDSDFNLNSVEFLVDQGRNEPYQFTISDFSIQSKSTNQSIDINSYIELADDGFVKLQAKLENQNTDWVVDASMDGSLVNTDVIQNLSEEVEELNGHFEIKGSIKGKLSQP